MSVFASITCVLDVANLVLVHPATDRNFPSRICSWILDVHL